jgi:hypothetical protein
MNRRQFLEAAGAAAAGALPDRVPLSSKLRMENPEPSIR